MLILVGEVGGEKVRNIWIEIASSEGRVWTQSPTLKSIALTNSNLTCKSTEWGKINLISSGSRGPQRGSGEDITRNVWPIWKEETLREKKKNQQMEKPFIEKAEKMKKKK